MAEVGKRFLGLIDCRDRRCGFACKRAGENERVNIKYMFTSRIVSCWRMQCFFLIFFKYTEILGNTFVSFSLEIEIHFFDICLLG